MRDRVGGVWSALAFLMVVGLGAACGSSGGSGGRDGGSGRDAGPDPLCTAVRSQADSCYAPPATAGDLCQLTIDDADNHGCGAQARTWLSCAVPAAPDGGSCPNCMDQSNAYDRCITGR